MQTKDSMPQPPQLSAAKQAWLKKRLDDLNSSGEHTDALTIGPRPANEPLPLSFAQQRLWFLQHLEPESAAYNEALAARLEGELDLEAFTCMIREVLSRHEVLRCRFPLREGQVEPVLDEQVAQTFEVPCEDLRGLAPDKREVALGERMQQELQRPFDLTTELPWRTVILRLEEQEYISLTIMHHLATDGWSWAVLYREFRTLYAAFSQQQPSPLPALPIQYSDYASWQRRWLESEEAHRQAAYWQQRLVGPLPHLDLPTDRPRGEEDNGHGGRVRLELGAVLGQQVQTFGRQEGITPFMALEAALVILLYRLTQQEEVLVGVPVAGRTQPELETLCGCFVNTLVLRQRVEGTLTVRELLQRVREETLAASDHQEYPFEKLVELLQPERDLGRTPFFEVLFSLQNTPREPFALPGVRWTPLEVVNHAAKFALSVELEESDEGIEGYLEYQEALFDLGTVERIGRQYVQIVREMLRDPEQQVGEIALWAEHEQEKMLARWNATEVAYPAEGSYRAYVQAQVQAQPQAVAVRDKQEELSYAQLWQQATRVSAHMQSRRRAEASTSSAEGGEALVGVYLERSVSWAVAVLAVLLAGDVYLPLEPGQPAGRVRYMVEHAGCRRIVTTRGQEQALRAALAEMAEQVEILYVEELVEQEPEQAYQEREVGQRQLAYVIYTSGSTGKPKGVMVEQRGLFNHLLAKVETLQLDAGDVVAQTASASFDISLWQLLAAWLVGAAVRIYPTQVVLEPRTLLGQVQADRVSVLEIVPTLLWATLEEVEIRPVALERLRWLIATGEALPADLCRRWFACYPQIPLINAYGPSECSDDVSHYVLTKPPRAGETRVPIGRPLPNLRLYVLDERMRPQPVGVWGEIYVGGSGVGRGYLDDAARTAQAFIPDPWSREPGARLYRTGDRGRFRANGTLEFGGRRDQQIKLRGYRIELEEIEGVIGRCRQVRTCAVGVVGEQQGSEQLVAYVVLEEGVEGSWEQALGEVRDALPAYMLPSAVVVLAELPLLASGKVDRKALRELAVQEQRAEYVEPRTEVEQQLAAIWREVLVLERVGIHDNFFAIGGHSLLMTRVLARVREVFDVWLSVRSMFKKPTIAGMATSIEDVRARSSALRQKRPAPVSREAYRQKRVVLLQDQVNTNEREGTPG